MDFKRQIFTISENCVVYAIRDDAEDFRDVLKVTPNELFDLCEKYNTDSFKIVAKRCGETRDLNADFSAFRENTYKFNMLKFRNTCNGIYYVINFRDGTKLSFPCNLWVKTEYDTLMPCSKYDVDKRYVLASNLENSSVTITNVDVIKIYCELWFGKDFDYNNVSNIFMYHSYPSTKEYVNGMIGSDFNFGVEYDANIPFVTLKMSSSKEPNAANMYISSPIVKNISAFEMST